MPRESKKKTPKKKTKEKSTKRSEDPKMDDEDEINRLMQNALDEANARAEQKFEERLTALREEFNQIWVYTLSVYWRYGVTTIYYKTLS